MKLKTVRSLIWLLRFERLPCQSILLTWVAEYHMGGLPSARPPNRDSPYLDDRQPATGPHRYHDRLEQDLRRFKLALCAEPECRIILNVYARMAATIGQ